MKPVTKQEKRDGSSSSHTDDSKSKGQQQSASQMLGPSLMSSQPFAPIPMPGSSGHFPGAYSGAPGGYNSPFATSGYPRQPQVSPSGYNRGRFSAAPSAEESFPVSPGMSSASASSHTSTSARYTGLFN